MHHLALRLSEVEEFLGEATAILLVCDGLTIGTHGLASLSTGESTVRERTTHRCFSERSSLLLVSW